MKEISVLTTVELGGAVGVIMLPRARMRMIGVSVTTHAERVLICLRLEIGSSRVVKILHNQTSFHFADFLTSVRNESPLFFGDTARFARGKSKASFGSDGVQSEDFLKVLFFEGEGIYFYMCLSHPPIRAHS